MVVASAPWNFPFVIGAALVRVRKVEAAVSGDQKLRLNGQVKL
jgi:hypothetical protein